MTPPGTSFDDSALFRVLFDMAPDAMVVVDRLGTIMLANPQADRLFGYPPHALHGRPIEDLLPAALRDVHVAHRTQYMDNPRVRPMGAGYELTGVRADGTVFPVEIGLSPAQVGGKPLFAASIRDISETQRARQALARARYDTRVADISRRILLAATHEAAMTEIPTLIAETLSVPTVAVLLVDPHGGGLRIAAAVGVDDPMRILLTGLRRSRSGDPLPRGDLDAGLVIRTPLAANAAVHPDLDAVLALLPDREAPAGHLAVVIPRAETFDRDRQHFLQSVANVLSASIQRGRSEEQLAHAQRLDALGQLTGGIAHDFNNLLTIVSGNLQLLEWDLDADSSARETIASASRAVERGSTLTRKLLSFSRRQRLNPQQVRTELLLADLSEMLARTLGERIRVIADCPLGLPAVFADPGELEAALVNLALNARDAMPRGGKISINARLHEQTMDGGDLLPGPYVVFTVVDSGEGMPPDVLSRAVEPFFTTKEGGKGSGLGLSMVYGFVKQSSGKLSIHSEPGSGTRVELYLPSVEYRATPVTEVVIVEGDETVLVVEDEDEVRRVAASFLRRLGYTVIEAGTAEAARTAFDGHPEIDVVFTDVVLGGTVTGLHLVDEFRCERPGLKVLMTSGYEYGTPEDGRRRLDELDLLRKPYRHEQLATSLRRVIDGG
jgi:PAS domain S-box-containing protein